MSKLTKQERMLNTTALYTFDLADVPPEQYAVVLAELFRNKEYRQNVDSRNRMVQTLDRMRPGTPELKSMIAKIKEKDQRLAETLFSVIVQVNHESVTKEDFIPFNTLLQYYVDYDKEGNSERVLNLSRRLNQLTFMADMVESILIDIKDDMNHIFNGEVQFKQFDAVENVMQKLSGFFSEVHQNDSDTKGRQLYMDYSDSINDYIQKRLKTYSDKLHKLHPLPVCYTEDQMVAAINLFFGTDRKFGHRFIAHTPSGGHYINAMLLASNLSRSETKKLDQLVDPVAKSDDAILRYCFDVTNVIMNAYHS